jgi:hypothetical protein
LVRRPEAWLPDDPNLLSFAVVERRPWTTVTLADGGTPPPSQLLIEFDPVPRRTSGGTASATLGGIRIPDFAVPTAEHQGLRASTDPLGSLSGRTCPFTVAQLQDRYPSADAYVTAYEQAVDDGVAAGFLRAGEAPALKAQGAEVARTLITW